MRTFIMQPATSLVGLIILLLGANCERTEASKDPMMAAESSSYFDLLKARSGLSPLTKLTPAGASSAYLNKQAHTYSEPEEIYKKEASEYWNNEVASQGEPLEEDYGYAGGQEQQQQSHGGYLSPQSGYMKGKEISVTPDHKPITLHYRTHSQPIMVHQTRIPGPKPEVKYTKSHEDPHRVVHEVIRPIIQVHEIIQPYRRVVQQVQPVIEEVRTVVAKDAGKGIRGGEGGGGGGGGGYGSPKAGQGYGESQLVFKKLMYEAQPSSSETRGSMTLPPYGVLGRSKVFINKRGVPVYQSHYMGPAYLRN